MAPGRHEVSQGKGRKNLSAARKDRSWTGDRGGPGRPFALVLWCVAMAIGGLGFGAVGDRRPFGDGILFHPLVLFFVLVAVALLALRMALARPVPDIISDRALLGGCVLGLVAFLGGNFVRTYLLAAL